jgi:hypothetical protein
MIGIPLIILLALLALYLLMRPRFEKHSLVAIGAQNEKLAVHILKDVLGIRGGKGPPEAPGVLEVLAKGRRGATRAELSGLAKDSPLFVNSKPVAGPVELKDGDRITFEKGGQTYTYLYFSGDVPADLSPFLPAAGVAGDEIVIEF